MALLQNVAEGFVPGKSTKLQQSIVREPRVTSKGSIKHSAEKAFEELFLAHYLRVVGILRRIVGDHARAEDLASEVFLKLYRRPLSQTPESNVPGWLYRTATNLGIDALRAASRRDRFEQDAARTEVSGAASESGLELALRSEREQRVRGVLADLKPEQAQLLVLRTSGYSYKELASALEVEPGSVGTLLNRAEAAFERRYCEVYGREEDV
jgi:RNA polymerase sigma-70 factor (ECF subfamily)